MRYGLIEAGGTKFVLGVSDETGAILHRHRIATQGPVETIAAACDWFGTFDHGFAGFGIGSFGPLDLNPASPDWGSITRTPKQGWSGVNLVRPFEDAFACPVAIDTDVNGAALAEARWGAGKGKRASVYLTIGTGIGGGAVIDGRVLHGLSHPEMGHMRLPRHPDDTGFAGTCPFHGACLEGLASGPAIQARWGKSLSECPSDGHERQMIAWYLGQSVCNLQSIMEPDCIVLGGGVMATPGLLACVQDAAAQLGADYFAGRAAEILKAPALGDDAGLMGAFALAVPA